MPILHVQCKLTYTKMTQSSTCLLLHSAPYKSTISSWRPPRCYSEFNFHQMETGCQLVPKMFSVTFLSGFCPQTKRFDQRLSSSTPIMINDTIPSSSVMTGIDSIGVDYSKSVILQSILDISKSQNPFQTTDISK